MLSNVVNATTDGTASFMVPSTGLPNQTVTATEQAADVVLPALLIGDVTLTEGNSGTKSFNFTVSMSGSNTTGASVTYATANGTATAGSDYVAANGTLTWAADDTSVKMISVMVNGDTTVEPDETFSVNLTSPTNATLAKSQGVGTIRNDDAALPALFIGDVRLVEGYRGTKIFTFNVSMLGSNSTGVSVSYATTNGTATAGSDYVATSGTLAWAAGDALAKTISITVNGDTTIEPDETFYVNLSMPTNATLAKSQGVGMILNDDGTLPALSIADVTLTEGNSGRKTFTFTVSMSGSNAQGASVRYATANGTAAAGSDYVATSGTLTWAAGNTSAKTISVTVNGDRTVEPDETFYVNLTSATNATLAKSQGVGTIQNDDVLPALSIGDVTLTEGNSGRKTFTFTVSMSGSNAQGASVRYATANGTASAGSDYVATSGTLTWAAGNTSAKTISVTVNGDTTVEPDETFYVNLTSATNATLSKSQGVGTIQNDDGSPTISSMAIVTPAATNTLGNPSQDARTLSVAALSVNASTSPQGSPVSLTNQQIAPIVAEAERRLAVALGTQVAASLNGVSVQLADLPNGILGETSGKTILIDRDAAGYGWFVDATPSDDVEFAAHLGTETLATAKGSTAAQRVDLLTAVMHELGHVLGYRDDSSGDLMNATLPLGVRRIVAVDEVFASFS